MGGDAAASGRGLSSATAQAASYVALTMATASVCVLLLDGLAPCSPPYDLMERPYILYKMLSAASARRILILLALQTPKSREELRSTPKFQSSTRDFNGSIN